MIDLKTKATTNNVIDFINTIEDYTKRQDSYALLDILSDVNLAVLEE